MNLMESVLYLDVQASIPGKMCELCGGECYHPSLLCLRCERRGV